MVASNGVKDLPSWHQYKLSSSTCDEYLFRSRDAPDNRKRHLDSWVARESAEAEREEMKKVSREVRAKFAHSFPVVPEAAAWLTVFKETRDR